MSRHLLALLLASVLAVAGLTLVPPTVASAEVLDEGVSASVTFPGSHNGVPVLGENGATGVLELTYNGPQVVPGKTYEVVFPADVVPKNLPLPDNKAITGLVYEDGVLKITFADPVPADVNQGKLKVAFQLTTVEKSKTTDFVWSLNQKSESVEVIFQDENDSFQDWTGVSAAKNGGGSVQGIGFTGETVTIDPVSATLPLGFTLTGTTTAGAAPWTVTDQLPAGMAYTAGSFSAVIETWDAEGMNKTTTTVSPFVPTVQGTSVTGQSFTSGLDVPANSRVTVRYQAAYDAAHLPTLQAALQAQYAALTTVDGQWLSVAAKNKATLDGSAEKTATVTARVQAPVIRKPDMGTGRFNKTRDWARQTIDPAADGTLTPAVPVTWTISADLRTFVPPANASVAEIAYATLTENVVIKDVLPAQAVWTMTPDDWTALGLAPAASATCSDATTATTFAQTPPMSYCLNGNTLWLNVGQDTSKNHSFALAAQITTVTGLTKKPSTTIAGASNYELPNTAQVTAVTAKRTYGATPKTKVTMVEMPEPGDGGFHDTETFTKEGPTGILSLKPGTSTDITYTFTVNGNNGDNKDQVINAADVKIVDPVNTEVFDLSDLAAIKAKMSGTYNGSVALTSADFALSLDARGRLVVELSATGKAKAVPAHKKWVVKLPLPTHKVSGKQTIDISNSAELVGTGETVEYWSEDESTMSSFGSEAEVRKFIRDAKNGAWTGNLRAEFKDGELVQDTYVYKVEFIAHGTFQGKMFDVDDVLPLGTEFVGFVTEENADTAAGATPGPVALSGGITASYDTSKRTMSLKSNNVAANTRTSAFFAVRIADADEDVPVVNKIGSVSATITPTDGYPLAISKLNSVDPTKVINDSSARFELRDAQGTVVIDDIFVSDNQLRVSDNGTVKSVVVSQPGKYTLHETKPPAGYVLDTRPLTITIATDVVPPAQTFLNDPAPASVRVGDYVWIDKDHDGLQDPSNDVVMPGVELKIVKVNADGSTTPVATDVEGMPVLNQVTDAAGEYSFEKLPVLGSGEKYRTEIVKTPAMLDGFVPTTPGTENGSGELDSSIGSADTTQDLTVGGAEDLTLDFGFVKPYVSVGDYVWIDVDKDGLQDDTDVPIAGVKLAIHGPDGEKVTHDVYGDPIVDEVTDARGKYLFDNLPVLAAGESYTVRIVQDDAGTVAALKGLQPTTQGADGGAGADDSSEWTSTSKLPLTTHQAQDLTLDFGFIRLAVSVGDYVWVDTDRDGSQGDPAVEPGIPGVLLEIYGPDGEKVTHDVDGTPLTEVRTDSEGRYRFENLPALENPEDSYTVKIVTTDPQTEEALQPYVPTTPGPDNGSGELDSSDWESSSTQDLTTEGSHDPTLDFGFVPTYVSVGDYVWIDVNRDGLQDGSDVPVAGVELKVELVTVKDGEPVVTEVTDVLGQPVGTTLTDDTGHYEFSMLPVLGAGQTYRVSIVKETLPAALGNHIPTRAGAGNDPALDSADWATDTIGALDGTVVPADPRDAAHVGADPTLDFGFVLKKVSVGNTVWFDSDEDGVRADGEDPISGVTLTITRTDGEPVTDVYGDPVTETTTDPSGRYSFDDLPALPPGTHYVVTVDHEKSPILEELHLVPTNPGNRGGDTDPTKNYSHTDSAESKDLPEDGDEDPTLDFGFRRAKVSVGDYVWIDVNRDGLQDASDIPLKGVVLQLTDPEGNPVVDVFGQPVEPTSTDAQGKYEFTNLPVLPVGASYTVTIVQDDPRTAAALKGLVPTTAGAGSDQAADSSTATAASWIDLSRDGAHDPTLDFGFQRAAVKVGDYVWLDANRNGRQNASEKGIGGVVLRITGPDGKPVTDVNGQRVTPVTTDANGHYEFSELPVLQPGQSYTVTIVKSQSKQALKGLFPTVATQGSRGGDSETGSATSWKDLTIHGAVDPTLDFGFYSGDVAGENEENPGDDGGNEENPGGEGDPGDDGTGGEVAGESEENGALPDTGAELAAWAIGAGLLLLIAGAGVLLRRRES